MIERMLKGMAMRELLVIYLCEDAVKSIKPYAWPLMPVASTER
jgi:hypothetical protein